MATVAHTIYSHYDPADRERLEIETGQVVAETGAASDDRLAAEEWQVNSAFIRQQAPPPRFVPAVFSFDEWSLLENSDTLPPPKEMSSGYDVAGWYRHLALKGESSTSVPSSSSAPVTRVGTPPLQSSPSVGDLDQRLKRPKVDKNNWFIMNALRAGESTERPASAPTSSTLADILRRDPPPRTDEEKFTPRVWLALGPANKGFNMLEKSGWKEGEPLGPHVARTRRPMNSFAAASPSKDKGKGKQSADPVRENVIHVATVDADVQEVRRVIDLTQDSADEYSDSADQDDVDETDWASGVDSEQAVSSGVQDVGDESSDEPPDSSRKMLITPLATRLKLDRLGVGLRAKTTGPYRMSQKRITHNGAALAAHIRAANEIRRQKAELGRGKRGFARKHKREESRRQRLLAYMNS